MACAGSHAFPASQSPSCKGRSARRGSLRRFRGAPPSSVPCPASRPAPAAPSPAWAREPAPRSPAPAHPARRSARRPPAVFHGCAGRASARETSASAPPPACKTTSAGFPSPIQAAAAAPRDNPPACRRYPSRARAAGRNPPPFRRPRPPAFAARTARGRACRGRRPAPPARGR